MSDPRAFAALLELEHEALLAAWRRRRPPSREAHIDGAAVLAGVVDALERDAAAAPGALREAPHAAGEGLAARVAEIGALRGCLHDLAAARGYALDGRALDVVNRALDRAIADAIRDRLRGEDPASRVARYEQLAFVAHDLRAPLNAIALAAEVLERVLPPQPEDALARRMLRSVRRNVEQISQLSDKALEASDPSRVARLAPARRSLELAPLVHAVVQELEPLAARAGTRLVNAVPEGLVVEADPELLARAFQNLVANGIDHAPGGEIVVGAETSSGSVVCWVRDDGDGISEQRKASVFRKGESTRPQAGAHGLGLPIVAQVIEAHGGRIAVESAEGFGATFWFELPGGAAREGSACRAP